MASSASPCQVPLRHIQVPLRRVQFPLPYAKFCFALSKFCFVMLSSALLCPSSDSVCQVPLRYARGPLSWLPLPFHWTILPSSAPSPPRGCWRTAPSKGTCARERRAIQTEITERNATDIYCSRNETDKQYVVYRRKTRESQMSTNCFFNDMHVPVLNEIEFYHALLKTTK